MEPTFESFDEFWSQTHARLCRFVCGRLSDPDDAEDVLQEVFLRIYRQSGSLRDPRKLESWMIQIARNRIIDHYRSRRAWTGLSETLSSADNPIEQAEAQPQAGLLPHVRAAVQALPAPYREALVLADLQGIPQAELAERMGISLSGAKSRVQRARAKVKAALLRCFDFELDARGQVMDYREHACCC